MSLKLKMLKKSGYVQIKNIINILEGKIFGKFWIYIQKLDDLSNNNYVLEAYDIIISKIKKLMVNFSSKDNENNTKYKMDNKSNENGLCLGKIILQEKFHFLKLEEII